MSGAAGVLGIVSFRRLHAHVSATHVWTLPFHPGERFGLKVRQNVSRVHALIFPCARVSRNGVP
jgi:hypothetical protein